MCHFLRFIPCMNLSAARMGGLRRLGSCGLALNGRSVSPDGSPSSRMMSAPGICCTVPSDGGEFVGEISGILKPTQIGCVEFAEDGRRGRLERVGAPCGTSTQSQRSLFCGG